MFKKGLKKAASNFNETNIIRTNISTKVKKRPPHQNFIRQLIIENLSYQAFRHPVFAKLLVIIDPFFPTSRYLENHKSFKFPT